MDQILRDIRYSARKLLRTPGFTTVVVATLALAIGATTAVFSIVDGVLLKSLPFASPGRIVQVSSVGKDAAFRSMSYLDFSDYRSRSHSFTAMAAIASGTANLTAAGTAPLRLSAYRVSAPFFDILGLHPVAGRLFLTGDDAKGAAHTVVLSEGTWRSRFGADPGIAGKVIDLDGTPTTVLGVAPKTASWPPSVDAWLPLIPSSDDIDPDNRGAHYLNGVARLAPGITVQRAATELADVASQLAHTYPQMNTGFSASARPLQEAIVGKVERPLYVLLGCVGFVLLIACANIANLLLVRASTRETEMAVRTALGASRAVLVRQLVVESTLLGLAGAAAGVLLAAWAIRSVVAFGPKGLPRLGDVTIDGTILGFTIAVAAVAALLFGLFPAIHAARANVSQMLREGSRGVGRAGVHRTRSALVIAEMALAVVLLVGAGLFMRSLIELTRVKLGYQPEHVVTMSVSLPDKKYPWDVEQNGFFDRVIASVRAVPGVQDAAIAFGRPLQQSGMRLVFEVAGWAPSTPENRHVADIRAVSPGFFSTLRIPLVAGRGLLPSDNDRSTPVLVVSQSFVKTFFPNESPIGKRVTLGYGRQRSADVKDTLSAGGTIVGVVGDIKAIDPSQPALNTLYMPLAQFPMTAVSVLARASGPEASLIAGMRNAIASVDNSLPLYGVQTMESAVSESIAQPRFYTMLLSGFAAIALIIAALGIYGVISYAVAQRTREMGIRMALGATQQNLIRMVVGEGLGTTAIGLGLGLFGAFELAQLVAKLLFDTPARDPATFGLVAAVLVGVAVVASYLPARRAAKVDPVSAIRSE